jgi:hypothetical protein
MSNYSAPTRHPVTGAIEMADWLDDHDGKHRYGVRFPSDGKIYGGNECNEISLHEAGVEIERLRGALKHYSCDCTAAAQCPPTMLQDCDCGYVARTALEGEKTNDAAT